MTKLIGSIFLTSALLLAGIASANAQATRTWVSGVGDDVNPCSRTAPCKTFAGAISKTAPKGEINVLDPGGFGAVTITKSISIISESVQAGVLVSGTNGIIINALATDVVQLRGLNFSGVGTGLAAIKIMSAGSVQINNCLIHDFKGAGAVGISVVPTAAPVNVVVSDTRISDNAVGVLVQPGGANNATIMLDRVTIDDNVGEGLHTLTQQAQAYLNNSVITGNGRGVLASTQSSILSFGNNVIANNTINGNPTSTPPLK